MGLLDHKQLLLIKGVGALPGDTTSVEQPLISLDLLGSGSSINLDVSDGWKPNAPSLKSGGVWADSPISDGRRLIAGSNTNVTETMRLIVSSQTAKQYTLYFTALQRMIQDARDYWSAYQQIEPVSLVWHAVCGAGPQYAIVYNIDMDISPEEGEDAQSIITLTIEREPGWRGVRVGGNPKEWTAYALNRKFTQAQYALTTSVSNSLVSGTILNSTEWTSKYVLSNVPYIDIPASSIPGDLPPLVSIFITASSSVYNNYYVGVTDTPTSLVSGSGNTLPQYNTLNANNAGLGTNATLANDTGSTLPIGGGTRQRIEVSFASGANASRASWVGGVGAAAVQTNATLWRGQYAAFIRCRQVGGASGDIQMYLNYGVSGLGVDLAPVVPTIVAGTGNTVAWPLTYLGIVSLPEFERSFVDSSTGLGLSNSESDIRFRLFASRSTGVGVLYIADIVLMPMHQSLIYLVGDATSGSFFYDTTGFSQHGHTEPFGRQVGGGTSEMRGAQIRLSPGRNNRLYILGVDATNFSTVAGNIQVGVNIVPRWTGYRDA